MKCHSSEALHFCLKRLSTDVRSDYAATWKLLVVHSELRKNQNVLVFNAQSTSQKAEECCIMRRFTTCHFHQILPLYFSSSSSSRSLSLLSLPIGPPEYSQDEQIRKIIRLRNVGAKMRNAYKITLKNQVKEITYKAITYILDDNIVTYTRC
jgi:hypothetical protein